MSDDYPYFPTYGEGLAHYAATTPDQIALRYGDRVTDYKTYDRHATQIANGLAAMGLAKGDRVAYFGKNSDRSVELALGAARAGMVFIPIIWRLAPKEVEFILNDSGAGVLFVEEEFADQLPFDGNKILTDDSFDTWRDAQSDAQVTTEVVAQDPLLQLYTSGTTGLPKGVVLSHHNGTHLRPLMKEHNIYWYCPDPADTLIFAMPYGHIAGAGTAISGACWRTARRAAATKAKPVQPSTLSRVRA